ncbi:MAG: efflux RND transporter periplasmic adaptor subunit [Candidatus Lambdaproteobacteria bacterium]|nr:efflux RND transporter periplasmic adaptor subunit [Candidatus Lambdaproteobacteria bacterium]
MKRVWIGAGLALVALIAMLVLFAGYWHEEVRARAKTAAGAPAPALAAREIAYYKHPDGKPDYSPVPKKDERGREYLPVYQDEEAGAEGQQTSAPAAARKPGKILYYRNPMGLPDVSVVPKTDPMGMAYIPVYEGEQDDAGVVRVNPGRVQLLGVRTEEARPRPLVRQVRATGTVQLNERTIYVVSPRFEGWIEKLLATATGEPIRRGDPLMEVYAPELVQAQQEYLVALTTRPAPGAGDAVARAAAERLAAAALRRLRNLDIAEKDIAALRKSGAVRRQLTVRAPASGIVLEKKAVQGMRFMPGEMLFQIADLSTIWVMAEVFEQDVGAIQVGQPATIAAVAYPNRAFTGKVGYVYPTVSAETRTVRVRVEIPNTDLALKPGMYVTMQLAADLGSRAALAIPESAVLDSGLRQTVLLEKGAGRFQPRAVRLGASADGYVEVLAGLSAGDKVVVSANFLIDAESNLKAALATFAAGQPEGGKEKQ